MYAFNDFYEHQVFEYRKWKSKIIQNFKGKMKIFATSYDKQWLSTKWRTCKKPDPMNCLNIWMKIYYAKFMSMCHLLVFKKMKIFAILYFAIYKVWQKETDSRIEPKLLVNRGFLRFFFREYDSPN